MRSRALGDGVQALQAWFGGRGFDRHRHDTYAIGLTDSGVQAFDYRGVAEMSLPGQVVVLHPDETHDGRAGTRDGFGYRIVYVAPARIEEAARAIRGRPTPLPFVKQPVTVNAALAAAITGAFRLEPEPLATDALVLALTEALLDADPSCAAGARPPRLDPGAVARARHFLDAATDHVVRSEELEAVTGLTRFELARQFRTAFGTSPYRYSLLRRLDGVRARLGAGAAPAQIALGAGFADQAHMSRHFKAAFGLAPARYQRLEARLATATTSSVGSTGLGMCMLYPAESVRRRSSTRPYAVSAIAGMRASAGSSSPRTRRINV
jgi:AraC-like DNA-binding protein